MPDFHLPERQATLIFEEGDLTGLELTVRLSLPFDALFKLQGLAAEASADTSLDKLRELLHHFAAIALVGWNLSNGSGPVKLTPAALTAHLDAANAGALLARYFEAVGGLPGPFSSAIFKWEHVKGAEGVEEPRELIEAKTIEAIALRYGVLPTTVLREDADYLLRHLGILLEAGIIKKEEPDG